MLIVPEVAYFRQLENTEALIGSWVTPPVEIYTSGAIKKQEFDFASVAFGHNALSQRACEAFADLISQHGELLSLGGEAADFKALHVTTELQPVDLEKSHPIIQSDGVISGFMQVMMRPEVVKGHDLFRMSLGRRSDILVSENIVKISNASGMTGAIWDPIWSDEYEVGPIWPYIKLPTSAQPRHAVTRNITCRTLSQSEQIDVNLNTSMALAELGITNRRVLTDVLPVVIERLSRLQREATKDGNVLESTSRKIGCLTGQSICDLAGWEWAVITHERVEQLAVVKPSRSHMVAPIEVVKSMLKGTQANSSLKLLINLIVAGNLPPATDGELVPLT